VISRCTCLLSSGNHVSKKDECDDNLNYIPTCAQLQSSLQTSIMGEYLAATYQSIKHEVEHVM
jgi:hypothetical protein